MRTYEASATITTLSEGRSRQKASGHSDAPDESLPATGLVAFAHEAIRQLSLRDGSCGTASKGPSTEELEHFCVALISDHDTAAADMIEDVRTSGHSSETICLRYLAAAARKLGNWWNEDRTSFAEVTVGTGRMLTIMHGINRKLPARHVPEDAPLVFASVPGEQHTFGVSMAAELFRRDGWNIALEIGLDHDDLVAAIERTPGSIVGLSVGTQRSFAALARLVGALHVRCPRSAILVSGQAVAGLRPFIANLAVDEIASDIDEAKMKLSELWDRTAADHETYQVRIA